MVDPLQARGRAARLALERQIAEGPVAVESHARDRYGRLVADAWAGGRSVAAELAAQGFDEPAAARAWREGAGNGDRGMAKGRNPEPASPRRALQRAVIGGDRGRIDDILPAARRRETGEEGMANGPSPEPIPHPPLGQAELAVLRHPDLSGVQALLSEALRARDRALLVALIEAVRGGG